MTKWLYFWGSKSIITNEENDLFKKGILYTKTRIVRHDSLFVEWDFIQLLKSYLRKILNKQKKIYMMYKMSYNLVTTLEKNKCRKILGRKIQTTK